MTPDLVTPQGMRSTRYVRAIDTESSVEPYGTMYRETMVVGTVSRPYKEAIAAVSSIDKSPYCVDAHTSILRHCCDPVTRKLSVSPWSFTSRLAESASS